MLNIGTISTMILLAMSCTPIYSITPIQIKVLEIAAKNGLKDKASTLMERGITHKKAAKNYLEALKKAQKSSSNLSSKSMLINSLKG